MGDLLATVTAHLRAGVSENTPQPLASVPGANCGTGVGTTGDPALPVLSGSATEMILETLHVTTADHVFVDGLLDGSASISMLGGTSLCESIGDDTVATDRVLVDLGSTPSNGTHLLQIQTDQGLLSNELPFVVQ
ncbi:MAG: hypothetical protein GY937_11005 [bacterium]|nr:hypothetical protein [bacterium]